MHIHYPNIKTTATKYVQKDVYTTQLSKKY